MGEGIRVISGMQGQTVPGRRRLTPHIEYVVIHMS